eukprot:gene22008-23032_t
MSNSTVRTTVNRRTLMKTGAGAAAMLFAPNVIRTAQAADRITLLTWETYHDDDWIAEWSKANNTEVVAVRIGSEDELFSQPQSGAVKADILYVETGSLPRFKSAGLIKAMDVASVKNAANISPSLDWKKYLSVGGEIVGLPYNWGTQPLMFDADAVKQTDTWSVLWDKAYAGKVNMFDDCTMTFPMIALHVGAKDPFNLTEAEFAACIEALRALRQQIRVIARGFDDATALYAAGDALLGYCQNVAVVSSLQ